MNIFSLLLGSIFIVSIGYAVINHYDLCDKTNKLLVWSYAYGLGVGMSAFQLYLYSRIGIDWNISLILLPWIVFFLYLLIQRKTDFVVTIPLKVSFKNSEKVLLFCIMLLFGYTFFEAMLRPVTVWDGWAIWLLRSKVFFLDGGIRPESLSYMSADYPVLMSLHTTFFYILFGQIDDTTILLTSTVFLFFLGVSFFAVVKQQYGRLYALFFTFLLLTTQNFIRHGGRLESGQADLPLAYYIFLSTILLLEYIKTYKAKTAILLSLFLGIASLLKIEGSFFAVPTGIFLFYYMIKKKQYKQVWIVLFWVVPVLDWYIYKQFYHLTFFKSRTFAFSLQRSLHIFYEVWKELINIKTWNILWILYLYVLVFLHKRTTKVILVQSIILLQLFIYIVIYFLFSEYNPESSLERLLLHVAPLALYVIAITTYDVALIETVYANIHLLRRKWNNVFGKR